jgi:heme exporter protein A
MAKLLVAHRPIWLLDEPTSALDTASEAMFAGLVGKHCAEGGIVIAATHRPLSLPDPQRMEMSEYRVELEELER